MTWLIDALEVANYDTISDGKIYLGDLSENESIRYSRSLSYWTQSGTGGSMSTGTITVDNVDGTYDSLLTEDNRDRLVVVTKNGVTAITGIIEGVEAPDDRTIRFRLKDVLSRLDRPIQRLTYGSEADSAVQGRVLPILFGIGRNIRPTLYDAVDASFGPGYRVADFSLSGATNVRDSGIELNPPNVPIEFVGAVSGSGDSFTTSALSVSVGNVVIVYSSGKNGDLTALSIGGTASLSALQYLSFDTGSGGNDFLYEAQVYTVSSAGTVILSDVSGGDVMGAAIALSGGDSIAIDRDGIGSSQTVDGSVSLSGLTTDDALVYIETHQDTSVYPTLPSGFTNTTGDELWTVGSGGAARDWSSRSGYLESPSASVSHTIADTATGPQGAALVRVYWSSNPQYQYDSRISNAGLIIDVEPAGVLTCDASTSGADQYSVYLDKRFYSEIAVDRSFTGSTGFRSTALNPFPSSDLPSGWGRVRTPADEGVSGDPYKIEYVDALKMTSAESDTAFIWLYTADSSSPEGDIVTDLVSGKTYRAIIEIESLIGGGVRNTKGNFRLRLSGSERILLDIPASRGQFADNTFLADFTVTEGSDQGLILAVEGDGIEVIIRRVEVFEADTPAIDSVSGITLSDFMQEVILRADESITKLDTDDLDTIAGGTPAEIGYYSEQPVTALSVMRNALDSYTADVYSDRSGNIRFSQLRDPALTNTSFLIDRERLLAPPRVRVDDAPGLTTQMVAKKNNYEFRDSDFADNLTAIPLETRQAYTQAGQANAQATVPADFPSIYSHAIDAEPLVSVFDTLSDAETEIQRVVDLYDEPRFIVDVEVALDEDEYVDLDDVVLLEYPRWGFDAGVNFLVVGVDDEISGKHGKRSARLRLWGSTGKNYTPAQPTAPSAIIDVLATEADDILTTESEELIGVTQ